VWSSCPVGLLGIDEDRPTGGGGEALGEDLAWQPGDTVGCTLLLHDTLVHLQIVLLVYGMHAVLVPHKKLDLLHPCDQRPDGEAEMPPPKAGTSLEPSQLALNLLKDHLCRGFCFRWLCLILYFT
jgi:hypothetical protein